MIGYLNGWPGVGKRTIGEAPATRLGARFVHDHLLHHVAIACCGLHDPGRWPLYDAVREAAYAALAARPEAETFVTTNALCEGSPRERAAWRHVVELAACRNARLIPVVLEASPEENRRRLVSADRVGRKLTDSDALASFVERDVIQKPQLPELLVLDVTALTVDGADGRRRRRPRSPCRPRRRGPDGSGGTMAPTAPPPPPDWLPRGAAPRRALVGVPGVALRAARSSGPRPRSRVADGSPVLSDRTPC